MSKFDGITATILGWVSGACLVLALLAVPAGVWADDGGTVLTSPACSTCGNGCPGTNPPCVGNRGCNALRDCNCKCVRTSQASDATCGCY